MNRPAPDSPAISADQSLPAMPPAWRKLTSAARCARGPGADTGDEAVPFGFSTRIVRLWLHAREKDRRLALWQRLSWRAACVSMALCAVVVIAQRGGGGADDRPLLEPPAIDFPRL